MKTLKNPSIAYSAEYDIWYVIKERCHNPKYKTYSSYGALGITVCIRWRIDFNSFLKDVGKKPSPNHIFCRKDETKGYTKDNCEWRFVEPKQTTVFQIETS